MKKENKEMLKTIISNQELIMKALKIEIPVRAIFKDLSKTNTEIKNSIKTPTAKKTVKKNPVKVSKSAKK
jgi:hypothetical protein